MNIFETKFKIGENKLERTNTKLNVKINSEILNFEMAVRELNFDKAIKIRNNLSDLFKEKN
ncbi:hypothetical protein COV11_04230 [Candidatus Woesearchaeota archaeon CG10_big_fil_rev_8_21_14_0_10_30_7]|nr:MAG: hypothetical protein COV11_04230 [Candidatus Woesearchaeota archaeon CG10_big_fil_rev_8_21_14_0_10_30_7]